METVLISPATRNTNVDYSFIDAEKHQENHIDYLSIEIELVNDDGVNKKDNVETTVFKFSNLPRRGKIVLVMCVFAQFLSGCSFSLLVPFYPPTAERKGMSQTMIGFVFGVFELVIFLFSPLVGNYLTKFGPKLVYLCGLILAGVCVIIFGTLDDLCPPGMPFIVISVLTRTTMALGFAAFVTASYAIVSSEFRDSIGTVFGFLETGSGAGFMVGPALGGGLYELGGYGLPFYFMGAIVLLNAILIFKILPEPKNVETKRKSSIFGLLRSPLILVSMVTGFLAGVGVGTFDSTFANHMKALGVSAGVIGATFMTGPALFALMLPLWGYLVDTKDVRLPLIIFGHLFYGLAMMVSGPGIIFPFLHNQIWTLLLGLVLAGLSLGCLLVPTITSMVKGAVAIGYENNIDTLALVSGLMTSVKALGASVGPLAGGVWVDKYGYRFAYSIVGFLHFFWIFPHMFLLLFSYLKRRKNDSGYVTFDQKDNEHQ